MCTTLVTVVVVVTSSAYSWPAARDGVKAPPSRRPVNIPIRATATAVKISLFLSPITVVSPYQVAGSARNTVILIM